MKSAYPSGGAVLTALVILGFAQTGAQAQTTSISEAFMSTTAPGWFFTSSSGTFSPTLTANTVDTDGTGWLRLTESVNNQSTAALFDQQVFSINAQIDITLEYTFWNGHDSGGAQNGRGADGLTFFLVDASKDSSNFSPGAYGGSLGYAQKTGVPGMAGGYLGFGFDNWGNYASESEGRVGGLGTEVGNGGFSTSTTSTTSGYPNRIAVRGPDDGDGDNTTGWEFIAASASLSSQMDFPLSTTRPDVTGTDYRAFHLTLDANNQLTVQMQFGISGTFSTVFTSDLSAYARPDYFKIGFTAGTGNANETMEVRNVEVVMTPFQAGSFEWDQGTSTTSTLWGGTPGGANANWYNDDLSKNDQTPTANSDILFAQKPLSGPQTVSLGSAVTVRSLTFDTSYDYTLTGSGSITLDPGATGLPSINVNDYNGAQAHHKINNAIIAVDDLRINNYSFSTLCINGTLSTGTYSITVNGTGAVNFNSTITSSGAITKNGSGLLTISADNSSSYTGNVVLNSGQTVILSSGALGNTGGTTTVNNGATLTFRGGVNYITAETVTISGSGWALQGNAIGAIYNDGGTNTFAGNIIMAADSAIGSRDGTLTLTGSISGAFNLTKLGDGVVVLANASNTYSGATIISDGVLRVNTSSNSLPGGFSASLSTGSNLQLNGGVLEIGVADTFARTLGTGNGEVQFTGDGGFSASGGARSVSVSGGAALTWGSTTGFIATSSTLILSSAYADNTVDFQNAINLNNAARTVRVDNGTAAVDAKLSGALTGTGTLSGLIKTGTGTLELTGTNTYVGTTEIQAGVLRTGTLSLPGGYDTSDTANNYGAVNLNGGVLELSSGVTFTRTLSTGEEGIYFGGDGGFSASGGARTVSLSGGAALTWGTTSGFLASGNKLILGSASSDNTLTFQNALNLNGTAQTILVQNGSASIDATLTGTISSNGSLTVTGSGVLTSTAVNTFTGSLTVSGAEFRLTGAGTTVSISGVIVQNGGTFTLDNGSTNSSNRLNDAATITLSGGTFRVSGRTSTNTTENVGGITLAPNSDNTIDVAPGGTSRSVTLTVSSLTRNLGSTINFDNSANTDVYATSGTNPILKFTTTPSQTNGILAYATVENDSFATVTTSGFILAATTTTTSINTAATTANVGLTTTTSTTLTASRTINSLRFDASSTLTITSSATLTLSSGGLLVRTGFSDTITGGTLTTTGGGELIVFTAPTSTLTISSVIADSSSAINLVKANTGTLVLAGTTANTYTGTTTVNGGTLSLAKTAGVTAIAGNITVGDLSGQDRLVVGANEQIANTANVTLRGVDATNRATLDLGDYTETFANLTIDGNAVVDFSGGNICAPAYLYLDDLLIASGSTLLIKNWIEFTDFLLVKNTSLLDENGVLGRITFEGYGNQAAWITYDGTWSQITPVPEPSTYGAIFVTIGLGFVIYRRRRSTKPTV